MGNWIKPRRDGSILKFLRPNYIKVVTTVNNVPPANTGNITITKADIGLGNVDNTSDLNKPVSTATQTALDLKEDKLITINEYVSNRNLQLTDKDTLVAMNSSSALQVIIPTHAGVAFPIGTKLLVTRLGTGTVEITAAGGVTVASADNKTFLRSRYSTCSLIKLSPVLWLLVGDLS